MSQITRAAVSLAAVAAVVGTLAIQDGSSSTSAAKQPVPAVSHAGPDESRIAAAISASSEGPDESRIAAAISAR